MDPNTEAAVTAKHIERNPAVCGGKPCVAGTRIRIWDVHIWHNLQGRRPEQIVADFPQLSVADVHAALAFYYDHREQIEQEMKEAEEFSNRLEADQGTTRYTKLKDSLRTGNDDNGNPVSS